MYEISPPPHIFYLTASPATTNVHPQNTAGQHASLYDEPVRIYYHIFTTYSTKTFFQVITERTEPLSGYSNHGSHAEEETQYMIQTGESDVSDGSFATAMTDDEYSTNHTLPTNIATSAILHDGVIHAPDEHPIPDSYSEHSHSNMYDDSPPDIATISNAPDEVPCLVSDSRCKYSQHPNLLDDNPSADLIITSSDGNTCSPVEYPIADSYIHRHGPDDNPPTTTVMDTTPGDRYTRSRTPDAGNILAAVGSSQFNISRFLDSFNDTYPTTDTSVTNASFTNVFPTNDMLFANDTSFTNDAIFADITNVLGDLGVPPLDEFLTRAELDPPPTNIAGVGNRLEAEDVHFVNEFRPYGATPVTSYNETIFTYIAGRSDMADACPADKFVVFRSIAVHSLNVEHPSYGSAIPPLGDDSLHVEYPHIVSSTLGSLHLILDCSS